LTVQNIKTAFTTEVYETHARIALEMRDLATFSQCLLVVSSLYENGIEGHRLEFISYGILYALHLNDKKSVILHTQSLSPEDLKNKNVSHAMEVVKAAEKGNYHQFFSLYLDSPNMSDFILDLMLDNMRKRALKTITTVYKDPVPISKICTELLFKNKQECYHFLATTEHKFDHANLFPATFDN